MQDDDVRRPRRADAQRGHEATVQQAKSELVRVEKGLRRQSFLDHGVGHSEREHRRPATAGAPRDLTDEQRPGTIDERHDRKESELRERQAAEQIFGDEGRDPLAIVRRGRRVVRAETQRPKGEYLRRDGGGVIAVKNFRSPSILGVDIYEMFVSHPPVPLGITGRNGRRATSLIQPNPNPMSTLTRSLIGAGLVAASLNLKVAAFPIAAPGTEGFFVGVSGTDPVIATYQGNSATYSNDLYLALDGAGNPGNDGNLSNDLFIFNNHASAVGSQVDLGTFAVGTELIFRLHVNNTGYDYYSGPGSRNPDGLPHARVQNDWEPNTTLVSFEDLFNTPEGINGYNDLSFSFENTASSSQPPVVVPGGPSVPEASTVLPAVALLGVISLAGRRLRRA